VDDIEKAQEILNQMAAERKESRSKQKNHKRLIITAGRPGEHLAANRLTGNDLQFILDKIGAVIEPECTSGNGCSGDGLMWRWSMSDTADSLAADDPMYTESLPKPDTV